MFGSDSFEIRLVVLGEPMGTGAMRLIEEGSRESACRILRHPDEDRAIVKHWLFPRNATLKVTGVPKAGRPISCGATVVPAAHMMIS